MSKRTECSETFEGEFLPRAAAHGGSNVDGGGSGLADGMLGRRRNLCVGDGLDGGTVTQRPDVAFVILQFEPGDIIFQQGDLGDSVYVIEEGECEVLHEQNDEQELLATLNRGECFGEMALLSDRTRNATIRARDATNVLIIPKADFNKLRQSVPAFGDVFSEMVKRRSVTGAPHPSVESRMLADCCGHPIPIPTPESELGPPPGMPTGDWGGDSGQPVILQR